VTQDENKLPTFDCLECTEHSGRNSQRDEEQIKKSPGDVIRLSARTETMPRQNSRRQDP